MRWSLRKIFSPRIRADRKSPRTTRASLGPMILSHDGRVVRLRLPKA